MPLNVTGSEISYDLNVENLVANYLHVDSRFSDYPTPDADIQLFTQCPHCKLVKQDA